MNEIKIIKKRGIKVTIFKAKFLIIFSCVLFSSCNDSKKKVSSGAAQAYASVFSKSCSGGSVNIRVETVSDDSTGVSFVDANSLKVGDKVQIAGTINKSICKGSGSISFSCEGVVQIDTNRAFVCQSGTVSSGYSTTTPLDNSSTLAGNTYKFLGGTVLVYQNQTSVLTRIVLSSSLQPRCPESFTCDK